MADVMLLVLGPVRLVTSDGKCFGRLGMKGKALLAYLAAQPDGCAERAVLGELLWDHGTQAEARHCLRQTLLSLRGELGPYADVVLNSDRNTLQLRLDSVDIDLRVFETAIRSGDDDALTSACRLWRGPFCDGLDVGAEPFEEWLLFERARLDELATATFRREAETQLAMGRFEAALNAAQRCVALNPLDDTAHAMLVSLYARRGWTGSARAAYRRCVELFRTELGEAPDKSVEDALIRSPSATDDAMDEDMLALSRYPIGTPPQALTSEQPQKKPVPVLAHYAGAAALSLAIVFTTTLALKENTEVGTAPAMQASKSRAWVEAGVSEQHIEEGLTAIDQGLAKVFTASEADEPLSSPAHSSSFSDASNLSYFYPLGC